MIDRKDNSFRARRYAVTAAPFVIGAVALYNWVISPHIGYLHAMQRLEPVMGLMAEEVDAVTGGLDEKLSTMRAAREKLATLRRGLLTPEESTTFLYDVQALAESAGCTMITADIPRDRDARKPEEPNVPTLVEVLRADLTVTGQYEQIVALLRACREQRHRVWVDSCRMDLVDPNAARMDCRLGLTAYALSKSGEAHP